MNLNLIKKHHQPNRVLDIGANVGQFCKKFKGNFPKTFVFCIEANSACEARLKRVNPNYKIQLLAKDSRVYNFYTSNVNPVSTGNSIHRELTHHFSDENTLVSEIHSDTLDNVVRDMEDFNFIKIDTQGSELDIISGGIETCKKAKLILLEVSHIPYNDGAPLYDDVISFMNKIGFTPVEILDSKIRKNSTPPIHQDDILFLNKNL